MIAIIDYGAGNLRSVAKAVARLGYHAEVTSDPKTVLDADIIILPGVGAAGDTMDSLQQLGMVEPIREVVTHNRPFLGICLGLQLLFSESEEFGLNKGIGVFEGTVKAFTGSLKISHMGWNTLQITRPAPILEGIKDGEFFVHALSKKVSDDLNTGVMEDRVAHIFMEADHIYVQDVLDVAPIFGELRKGL